MRCITDKICDLTQCEIMIQDTELSPSPNAAYVCACMCVCLLRQLHDTTENVQCICLCSFLKCQCKAVAKHMFTLNGTLQTVRRSVTNL